MQCNRCCCLGPRSTNKDAAIESWNIRLIEANQEAKIMRIEEEIKRITDPIDNRCPVCGGYVGEVSDYKVWTKDGEQ